METLYHSWLKAGAVGLRLEQVAAFFSSLVEALLAIAWVLSKGDSIVPLIGARTRAQLKESLGALDVRLSPADVARIEATVPAADVAGTRYDEHQMRILDSERRP